MNSIENKMKKTILNPKEELGQDSKKINWHLAVFL